LRDEIGYTPLHQCAVELIHVLLRAGSNPNEIDNWGQTVLSLASQDITEARPKMIALLSYDYSSVAIVAPALNSAAPPPPPQATNRATSSRDLSAALALSSYATLVQRTKPHALDVNIVNMYHANVMFDSFNNLSNGSDPAHDAVRQMLLTRSALSLNQMAQQIKGGCGKLDEIKVQFVMKHFSIPREEAGLALSCHHCRVDWLLEAVARGSALPKPGDPVDWTKCAIDRRYTGFVTRGPDWCYDDSLDGGGPDVQVVGYVRLNMDCPKFHGRVHFPLATRFMNDIDAIGDKWSMLRLGFEGKHDLVYAPYRYPLPSNSSSDSNV